MSTHEQTVHSQFEPRAQAYLTSAVHSSGPDLERARTLVSQIVPPAALGLDIGMLRPAHLVELEQAEWPTRLEFVSWVERMRTPADRVAVIRSLQEGAPAEIREALRIEADGSFTIRTGLFWLRKPV